MGTMTRVAVLVVAALLARELSAQVPQPRLAPLDASRRVVAGQVRMGTLGAQPSQPRASRPVNLQFSIQSSASVTLRNVAWQVTAARPATEVIARGIVATLEPGQSVAVSSSWIATAGAANVQATADPANTLAESPEAFADNRSNVVSLYVDPAIRLDAISAAANGPNRIITLTGDGFAESSEPINVYVAGVFIAQPEHRIQFNYNEYAILSRSNTQLVFRGGLRLAGPTNLMLDVESGARRSNALPFRWEPLPERQWIELGYSYGHNVAGPINESRVRLAGEKSVNSGRWYNSRYASLGYARVMPSAPHYLVVDHVPQASTDPRITAAPDGGVDEFQPGTVLQNGCVLEKVEFKSSTLPPVVGGTAVLENYSPGGTNANVRVRWNRKSGASVTYHLAMALTHPGTNVSCGAVNTVPFDRVNDPQ